MGLVPVPMPGTVPYYRSALDAPCKAEQNVQLQDIIAKR